MKVLNEKMMTMTKVDVLDDETVKNIERIVILRTSTKHINLWMRQLETKRNDIREFAELLKVDEIKKEIEKKEAS